MTQVAVLKARGAVPLNQISQEAGIKTRGWVSGGTGWVREFAFLSSQMMLMGPVQGPSLRSSVLKSNEEPKELQVVGV